MCVAAQIVEDLLGAAERLLGIDNPVGTACLSQIADESAGLGQLGKRREETQLTGVEGLLQTTDTSGAGTTTGFLACPSDDSGPDRLIGEAAREQPVLRSADAPVFAQDLQQPRREHDIAVGLTFALFDA